MSMKAEEEDQAMDVDQSDDDNKEIREPSQVLMKCHEHAWPQKVELLFDG